MEQREHWWNGTGASDRVDVFLRVDGDAWQLERRVTRGSEIRHFDSEDAARDALRARLVAPWMWRRLGGPG